MAYQETRYRPLMQSPAFSAHIPFVASQDATYSGRSQTESPDPYAKEEEEEAEKVNAKSDHAPNGKMRQQSMVAELVVIKWAVIVGFISLFSLLALIAFFVIPPAIEMMTEGTSLAHEGMLLAKNLQHLANDSRIQNVIARAEAISVEVSAGIENAKSVGSQLLDVDIMSDVTTVRQLLERARQAVAFADGILSNVDPAATLAFVQNERLLEKSTFLITFTESMVRQNGALLNTLNATAMSSQLQQIMEGLNDAILHVQEDGIRIKLKK